MKNVQVGDSVYCLVFGEGVVIQIEEAVRFPITVDYGNFHNKYSKEGDPYLEFKTSKRTLYYSKPEFDIPPEPVRPKAVIHGVEVEGFLTKDSAIPTKVLLVDMADIHGVVGLVSKSLSDIQWQHCLSLRLLYPDTGKGRENANKHLNALTGGEHVPF